MSIRIMSAVWGVTLPDSEKIVLLALADAANDDGICWPSMAALTRKCSKSDRTIQAAIKALAAAGHLTREERVGKGCLYTVHPRSYCTPEVASPPKRATRTPEAASDKPSRTTISSRAKALSGRATALPDDFEPVLTPSAQATVDGWPPGKLEAELGHFRDRAIAKGETFKDWQAAFRTWIANAEKFRKRDDDRSGKSHSRQGRDTHSVTLAAAADAIAFVERRDRERPGAGDPAHGRTRDVDLLGYG